MEKILKFFSTLLLFTTITAVSQTTEERLSMHAISQNKDDKILIRFAPTTSELWRLGNNYGYSSGTSYGIVRQIGYQWRCEIDLDDESRTRFCGLSGF
jgi:hypothetical protein